MKPKNASAIANAVMTILENPVDSQKMADAAFRLASEKFTIDAMGAGILKLYDKLLFH